MNRFKTLLPTDEESVDLAFAIGLTLIALVAFRQSFGGSEYFVVGAIGALLGAFVSHVGNKLKAPVLVVSLALMVAYVVIGGTVALRADATAGFLPSVDTVTGSLHAIVGGWKELLTTVPPVGSSGTLMALPMFCGIVSAGGAVLWSNRVRALVPALLMPTAVMVLGLLCGLEEPVSVLLHGGVFAAAAIVWMSVRNRRVRTVVQQASDRRRRTLGAAGLVVAASVFGLIVGPSLPFAPADNRVILRDTIQPPFDPSEYPSPLVSYRNYVKANKDTILFTITGLPNDVPIRLATMDDYDGVVWRVTGGKDARAGASGYFERVGSDVSPQFEGERAQISVEMKAWSEVWIPTVGEVTGISFGGPRARDLSEAFRYNLATDTAASQARRLQPGDSYVLDVVLPPSDDEVKGGVILDVRGKSSSNSTPEALISWAAPFVQRVARDERPRELATRLKEAGVYSSGDVEQEIAVGGHNSGRLKAFITQPQPVGNAEQFAASLGLMLRGDSIPARVVMGFMPKEWNDGPIDITGENAEAWVEVPIEGLGWANVLTTPVRTKDELQDQPAQKPQPERNTQIPPPPPVLAEDPRSDPAKERQNNKDDKKTAKDADSPEGDGIPRGLLIGVAIAAPPSLLIGAVCTAIVAIKARRRHRRRTRGSATERITNGWREVLDNARDFGRPMPPKATRTELAGFVGTTSAPELARHADIAVFAPGESSTEHVEEYWDQLELSRKELQAQVGFVDRLKSRVSLTSLRRKEK